MFEWLHQFWFRLTGLFKRRRLDQDLQEELEFHLAMREEQLRRDGARDAQATAKRRFGNPTLRKEESREAWCWMWLDRLAQDVRYASRTLRKSPGFTLIAVLTIGVGVGATTSVFGVIDQLMFRPPTGVSDPEELVALFKDRIDIPGTQSGTFSYPQFLALRGVQDAFDDIATYWPFRTAGLRTGDGAISVRMNFVTDNYFEVLGVEPFAGRTFNGFNGDEDARGSPGVAMLAHRFWVRHFTGDQSVLGRTIHLTGVPFEIVGILPPDFRGSPVRRAPSQGNRAAHEF